MTEHTQHIDTWEDEGGSITTCETFNTPNELLDAIEREYAESHWWESVSDVGTSIKTFLKEFGRSLRNFWRFKGVIWNFRDWDFGYNISLLSKSLEYTRESIKTDRVCQEYLTPKLAKIDRFMWLFENYENALELVEKETGIGYLEFRKTATPEMFLEHTRRINKLEQDMWTEMWTIIGGSGVAPTTITVHDDGEEFELEITDGTNAKNWWS